MATKLIVEHDNETDADRQIELIFQVVEAIVVANGYEWNRSWWEAIHDYGMLIGVSWSSPAEGHPPPRVKKSNGGREVKDILFERVYFLFRSKGLVASKWEFFYGMDILGPAGLLWLPER